MSERLMQVVMSEVADTTKMPFGSKVYILASVPQEGFDPLHVIFSANSETPTLPKGSKVAKVVKVSIASK